jgi:hypothetical protein
VHGFEISGGSPGSEALCLSLLVVGEEQLAVGPVPVAMLDFGDTGVRLVLPILEPAQALTITIHNMTRHNRRIRPVGEQVS